MNNWIDLHLHSTYSFLDGYGTVGQILGKQEELGRNAVAITDHGNISSHPRLEQEAKSRSIKPIFGCEFYIVPTLKENSRKKSHITVLAKNDVGYSNLLYLTTLSWENFYYKPTLDVETLVKHSEGLMILSGCNSSLFAGLIREGRIDKVQKLLKFFNDNTQFFVEIQPFDVFRDVVGVLHEMAQELAIPEIITCDIHYFNKGQHNIQKVLHCISWKKKWEEMEFSLADTMYPRPWEEVEANLCNLFPEVNIDWNSLLGNIEFISDSCNVELPRASGRFLGVGNNDDILKKKSFEGLAKKGLDSYEEYITRLNNELNLVISKKFCNYLIFVSDFCEWAKSNNIILAPARGSSAGSLICYVLGITEIDPVYHQLPFERFLDESREDYPDIDIDCEKEGRDLILSYLYEKYGEENVGQLATFAEFKGKNSIDEIGKIFSIPPSVVASMKAQLPYWNSLENQVIKTGIDHVRGIVDIVNQYPSLKIASLLEGQFRHLSAHAGGFIISNDIAKCCAVYKNQVLSCDKDSAAYLGFVKVDVLVLKTLTNLKRILSKLDMNIKDLYDLSLEDEKILEAFDRGDVLGIFQFNGKATKRILYDLSVKKFAHLVDINALSRPGLKQIVEIYIKRSKGRGGIEVISEEYNKITEGTYGLPLYQEQVMQLVRNIGGFSWEETNKVRKAISNKMMGEQSFVTYREMFMVGAEARGYNIEVANKIWDYICQFGTYAFNRSHAVAYTVLAYWMMYFKQYHPLIFYWSSLISENDEDKREDFLKEIEEKRYTILPIDLNKSEFDWIVEENGIRSGLNTIKGIGEKVAEEIAQHRPYSSLEELRVKCSNRVVNIKVLNILNSLDIIGIDGLSKKEEQICLTI